MQYVGIVSLVQIRVRYIADPAISSMAMGGEMSNVMVTRPQRFRAGSDYPETYEQWLPSQRRRVKWGGVWWGKVMGIILVFIIGKVSK